MDKDYLHHVICEDAPRSCGDDHQQKTKPEVNSRDVIK